MYTARVNTDKPYDVIIGNDLLSEAGKYILKLHKPTKIIIISDNNVSPIYLQEVQNAFEKPGFIVFSYIVPSGEETKNMSALTSLLEFMAQCGMGRTDLLVALGGGVVGDLAGFAAAIFQRGIHFIQMPTTLLSAVDSSVGGKTAVNLSSGKNLVGAFWQPILVLCDTSTLGTLSRGDISSGVAECIKYALLHDQHLLAKLTQDGFNSSWDEIIYSCVKYKSHIVTQDEKEHGVRKLLNLGHTVGHAIEKLSSYQIRHGEAIGIGMLVIANACAKRLICGQDVPGKIQAALEKFNLPLSCKFSAKEITDAALNDKKRHGNQITLILIKNIGECFTQDIHVDELLEWISLGMEE